MASTIRLFYSSLTLSLGIFILMCTLRDGLGCKNHLDEKRISDNITYELDACACCKTYEPFPTHSLRSCSVGRLKAVIHELKRIIGDALRAYEFMHNMGIEEEERNGMFRNYNYQTVFSGSTASWMQTYDKIHSTLHEISLNMAVMELFVNQTLVTSFVKFLQTVMCHLQATLKLADMQVTCRRSLTLSMDIENAWSTYFRINFSKQSLLTARDALNETYNVVTFDDMRYLQL